MTIEEVPVEPCGWRLLLKPVPIPEKTAGGIIRPDSTVDNARLATVVCQVVSMGKDAYAEKEKFCSGPHVEPGTYVLIERFAGAKFHYKGTEYRIMNDDEVIGITTDPDNITHF